jgi:signal transduction histidine kinase
MGGNGVTSTSEDAEANLKPEAIDVIEDAWLDRAKAFAGRFSIRTKIVGIVLALTAILGLGITWQVRGVMSALAQSELIAHGEAIATEVADQVAESVAQQDSATLAEILDNALTNHPDTVFATVSRQDGVVIGTAVDRERFPTEYVEDAFEEPQTQRHGLHTFPSPIAATGGMVTVGLTDVVLVRTVNGLTFQMLLTTLFAGAIGVAAATFVTWVLTRPIVDLVKTTHQVSHGDLSARATVTADDEIGTLATVFNEMVSELERGRRRIAETEQARKRLLEQLIDAQEVERKRIARELHDDVGQSLSGIMLSASLIERSGSPEQATAIREAAAETLTHVRRLGRELRPSVLDDLGLVSALERYAAEFRLRYPEMTTEFLSELSERVSPVIETTIYRVVQEAMTNVARHSGARALSVVLTERGGVVRAIVEDDGSGFDPSRERRNAHSVGIHGMIERVELLGGRLDIESSDTGTAIYASVPTMVTDQTT